MKQLQTITDKDIYPDRPGEKFVEKYKRYAARVVVVDQEGRVALMYTRMFGYHKLPGGGVDEGEDGKVAAAREALEETGCKIGDITELGCLEELRPQSGQRQINFGYLGRVIGKKGEPKFTESEIHEQFEVRWYETVDVAIAVLKAEDHPTKPDNQFMRLREMLLLEAAKQCL